MAHKEEIGIENNENKEVIRKENNENKEEIGKENKEVRKEENREITPGGLEEENRRLLEENERLKREREEYQKSLPLKERLYDHVNVSLKTMDRIIALLFILLGAVLVMGIVNR